MYTNREVSTNRPGDFLGTVLDTARYHPFLDRFRFARARVWFWKRFRPQKYETLHRINLGCGPAVVPGLCNVDVDGHADLRFNFLNRFPLPDGIAEWVYCEHTLEHFHVDQAPHLVREVHRVLRPGGVFRVSVPKVDVKALGRLTGPELADVSRRLFGHEHKSVYSHALLRSLLEDAGFAEVAPITNGGVRWMPADIVRRIETRRERSLIVEGKK